MSAKVFTTMPSPIGTLTIVASNSAICALGLPGDDVAPDACGVRDDQHPLLRQACAELHEYFTGARRILTLPIQPAGTPFQLAVWTVMRAIPYGETRSYGELAAAIGKPAAARAVGIAVSLRHQRSSHAAAFSRISSRDVKWIMCGCSTAWLLVPYVIRIA